jgi:hypothetical protein
MIFMKEPVKLEGGVTTIGYAAPGLSSCPFLKPFFCHDQLAAVCLSARLPCARKVDLQ